MLDVTMSKHDVLKYLDELALEMKKLGCTGIAELVIVGGCSLLLDFDFRDTTIDIDFVHKNGDIFTTAARNVAKRNKLSDDWLNDNVRVTKSFSPKLFERKKFYNSYQGNLMVFTIEPISMLAMKLVSFREDSNDILDIENIFKEIGTFTLEKIMDEIIYLYGSTDVLTIDAELLINKLTADNVALEYAYKNHETLEHLYTRVSAMIPSAIRDDYSEIPMVAGKEYFPMYMMLLKGSDS